MKGIKLIHCEEVEGLRVGRFKGRINTTCIVYRIGSTVIDTGPPNQWLFVKNFLREKEVKQVLITHHHEDHGGNGSLIQKEMQVPVFAHSSGIESHINGFPLRLYQYIVWGKPAAFRPEIIPAEIDLENGLRLKVIHAPGHSDDMTCYLEPNRGWLFTGDLFIAGKPAYMRQDEEPNQQINSLKEILTYNFDKLFCSHRGIVNDGHKAIQNKLNYLEELRDKIQNLHKEGKTVDEITGILMGKESIISLLTLNHFSKKNIVKAFLSPPAPLHSHSVRNED
jgi:glyoxylase-like metal-dependent hydrolase (beta-lactamase superfamily II)